jgi:hypothetical protein
MVKQFYVYDALYASVNQMIKKKIIVFRTLIVISYEVTEHMLDRV